MLEYAPDQCDVSVVLPVYNEKGHLRTEIDRIRAALEASKYTFELIVVDDGSNDGSEKELQQIPGITLIRHRHNSGSGAARRTGTTAARGRVVVWTDVDMTYPNNLIPELATRPPKFGPEVYSGVLSIINKYVSLDPLSHIAACLGKVGQDVYQRN